jgi:hypothetical protein
MRLSCGYRSNLDSSFCGEKKMHDGSGRRMLLSSPPITFLIPTREEGRGDLYCLPFLSKQRLKKNLDNPKLRI